MKWRRQRVRINVREILDSHEQSVEDFDTPFHVAARAGE